MSRITKVSVSIDNEYWEQWTENSNKGGVSKKNTNYLKKVIQVLEQALEQAKAELITV